MADTYTYIMLSQAAQQLANRLFDPSMTFWTQAELVNYLQESLRTWNALTAYWRGDFIFPTVLNQTWYDLTGVPNTLRPYTVTDAALYIAMQYHLLEPAVGINPWTGVSAQFTAGDLLSAVQRRRDEILSTVSCTLNRRTVGAVAGRIILPDTVIDIRRLAYLPSAGASNSVVWPDDTWSEQAFNRNYPLLPAGIPLTYLQSTEPPISFDTDVPPAFAGLYELLTVEAGAALDPTAPQTLLIPDDWTHVIKWGALADLLSRESNAKDIPRAAYCEKRYQMGLKLLSSAPALLALRIDNVPVQIDSVRDADLYNTFWEAQAAQKPSAAYHAGLNLLALAPVPDAGPYSMTATVVRNAPVPVFLADNVQVARDDLDVIIDYAQHLAAFKMGGQEFAETMPLFQRFLAQAAIYNRKLLELGEFTKPLYDRSQRENNINPVMVPEGE